jgi:hypothetical protein
MACTGAESGYNDKQESIKEAGAKCKNRDKFIYFIVRVMLRLFFSSAPSYHF